MFLIIVIIGRMKTHNDVENIPFSYLLCYLKVLRDEHVL